MALPGRARTGYRWGARESGNVARKNGGAGLWHVGRLCLATAPLGLRMWTFHAAPWKGKRAVSSGGCKGQHRG
eukprot:scaffold17342_cov130-Isochrysis_galbana.AAC.3